MAQGPFAPGHVGELTQAVPFDMVDEALAETRAVQSRVRDLPSRVVVYLLLAACLFPELGYPGVWRKLTASLDGLSPATPTASALHQARRRLGPAPLKWLFDLLRGPSPTPVRWRGLLVCAVDGTMLTVADSPANLSVYTKHRCNNGGSGYPQIRLLALVACGTRTLIDAVFGPTDAGETTYAPRLARSLREGMIVLLDHGLVGRDLISGFAATGAEVLVRYTDRRNFPVLARYPDGSYLSTLGSRRVRVIDAEITITTSTGRHTGLYRLVTTLLDHHRHPAGQLVTLYHQRWEIETAFLELKSTILGGRVLRARTPQGITQEVYALLVTYQLLRTTMADATDTRPSTAADRASFTVALQTARDQLVLAAGVIADTVITLVGTIGTHVLANLMPDRRLRTRPRVVKRAISKYNAKGNVDRTTYKATISIDIVVPAEP
ncbi:Transposase DDE domain-containing protein [Lentzea aerocolonigenes]|nr:Transposase DDE domain-containing protein [Lentzea aerocolonigenes]